MRLYTLTGATALDDPEFGHFDADENGAFDLPNELSARLHGFALRGRPLWETDVERQHRLINEELERRKDPATLLDAVQQLVQAAQSTQRGTESEVAAPAKRTTKRTAAKPSE